MDNKDFAGGLIEFDAFGRLVRLGDYAESRELNGTSFAFQADGCCCDFAPPEIRGEGNLRTLRYLAQDGKAEVTVRLEYDGECGVLNRRDTLRNLTDAPLMLRRYLSRFELGCGEYEVAAQRSLWCRENESAWQRLYTGRLELGSRAGRWCEGCTPFAAVRDLYASHALAFLVLPAGDWTMRFSAMSVGGCLPGMTVEAGLSDDMLQLEVAPGETWQAPEVLVQILPDREFHSGSAGINRWFNRRYPARSGHQPVVYNTWLDRTFNFPDIQRLESQLEAAREIGCEVFVIDYGWYEDLKTFTRVDNWAECTDRAFCGKMREFADKVRQAGLGFGFWVEFEFFSSRSRIVQEKPYWFFNSEHPDIVVPRTWIPEVEEMLVQSFAEVIRRYKAVFIKNDMNHSQGYDPAHLYRYQQGVARIMGRLREMFPEVTFEHCASGAMRHAAGPMLDAFDTHFISDNAAPLDCLRIAANQALRFPVGRISRWYVGSELHHANEASQSERRIVQPQLATWNTYQAEDLHFGLLSNLTGILGFSCDLASFSPENRRIMAEYTAFYKSIRQHCAQAEMHLLTPPECFDKRRGWLAMQITLPTIDTHLCYAFHYVADGDERRFFHLKELDAAGKYTVSTVFPERKLLASEVTGRELMTKGLEVCFSYDQQLSAFKGQLIRIEPA